MAIEIKLPALGDNIDSGDVLEVKVHEGDMIQKDQGILEIETDKATVEVPSSHAGKVLKVHIREGESIPIGAPLITLEESAGAAEAAKAPAAPPSRKAPAAQETPPPKAAKPAAGAPAPAKPREPEAPSETRKGAAPAPMEAQAKEAEAVKKPPAASAPSPPAEPRSRPAASTPANPPSTPSATTGGGVAAGPSVRRFAREVGVDLSGVAGSGPHGRVTRDDVLSVVRTVNEVARGKSASGEGSKAAEETGEHDAWGPVRLEKLTKIRKTIASKMSESWSTATRVTNFDDADVTELDRLRQSSKGDYAADGIKLTSLPFVIKAVAMSLKKHVTINASIDLDNGQIIYKNYVNVGVAVDTDRGLVVPSLRHADKVSIPEIARQLAAMAENVRQGNFSIDDLRGSTFTISNLGSVGGTYSTPMINVPEVAILLLGRSRRMPVAINDQVVVRLMMPLSLSYDHRLVDGAAAARFLNEVKGLLEAPSRLLLAP